MRSACCASVYSMCRAGRFENPARDDDVTGAPLRCVNEQSVN